MKVNLGGAETHEGGPGSKRLKGYVNVDIRKLPGVNVTCDLRNLSQFEDESWEEVRMSHAIEHFTEAEALSILSQIYQKLKPGGKLRLYCPDAYLIATDYIRGEIATEEFSRLLFGNQKYPEELHKMALDKDRLTSLVERCGFKVTGHDPRPNAYRYDLGIQAVKE